MNSLDVMKAYAVANETWEEEKKEEEKDPQLLIHLVDHVPWANSDDARRFVNHLEEIFEMKVNGNATNLEIANRFSLNRKNIPRLIKQYFCKDEARQEKMISWAKQKLEDHHN